MGEAARLCRLGAIVAKYRKISKERVESLREMGVDFPGDWPGAKTLEDGSLLLPYPYNWYRLDKWDILVDNT
jgi:hypothetical protein